MYPSASCPLSSRTRNILLRSASITSPSTSSFSSWSFMARSCLGMSRRDRACGHGAGVPLRRDGNDVRRLGALLTLARLELDARTFRQALEAIAGDVAEVHEEILRSLVRGDEAVHIAVVEPLHGSGCHRNTSLTNSRTGRKAQRANRTRSRFAAEP